MMRRPNRSGRYSAAATTVCVIFAAAATAGPAVAATPTEGSAIADVIEASAVVRGDAATQPIQEAAVARNTVTVGTEGAITVTLPVSAAADVTSESGLLALSDGASSSVVPVVLEDGSVAIHSVLQDENAPTSYDYILNLPAGAALQIDEESGGAYARNANGSIALFIAAPWALDADQKAVPTHYSVQGNVLTQHIAVTHATRFPVVADPWLGVDLVASFGWTYYSGQGWRLNVDPTLWARGVTGNPNFAIVGAAGWDELYNKVPSSQRSRMNSSGAGQYICHMGFAGLDPQWNMEMWKPAKQIHEWIATGCN